MFPCTYICSLLPDHNNDFIPLILSTQCVPHIPFALIPKKSQVFCATMEKRGFPGSRRSWGLSNCKGGAQAEEKVEEKVEEEERDRQRVRRRRSLESVGYSPRNLRTRHSHLRETKSWSFDSPFLLHGTQIKRAGGGMRINFRWSSFHFPLTILSGLWTGEHSVSTLMMR